MKKGKISVKTTDIFPIIKKWLYSEHDIFLRELVANATDAITKRATLGRLRNEVIPTGEIKISIDKKNKTITITDNGIGMTEEEVEKYIAQLAFSGAEDFVKKINEAKDDIIGKFGLGFYSSFMVASKVEVDTLSMERDAKPIKWVCEGDTEYEFSESSRNEIGTSIILHIGTDGEEFLDTYKMETTLKKFCDFMPYSIKVVGEKGEDVLINETTPLWKRDPKEIKDEEYLTFFKNLFPMEQDPLFWVHLKIDHPFTLEGILYFPKFNSNKPFHDSNIKLYCKQVFVSDNVKHIIPDFLSLLKGVIDSTDIPLNVSRSSLQGDPNVKKISNYVVKKVGDALKGLFNKDRSKYESIWQDIGLFVKYGCISDTKFDEAMRDQVIFKTSPEKFVTLEEYKNMIPEIYRDKMKDLVLYFENGISDWTLKKQLENEGIPSIDTDSHIDPHFMQHLEIHKKGENQFRFSSIDNEIGNVLGAQTSESDNKVAELFKNILSKDQEVIVEKLKGSITPAYFKVDEQMKRFSKMTASMGTSSSFPIKKTLVINPDNELIKNALAIHEKGNNGELVSKLCHYVEDLANISSEGLKNEDRDNFVKRSQELLKELTTLAL